MPLFFSATASAQVFDSGPSDPALFTNVINLPESVLPEDGSIGGVAGETIQLNVANGGAVGTRFSALEGSEVNISGGSVGFSFRAFSSSEVNISGGSVGSIAAVGGEVNVSGGSVNGFLNAQDGSAVNISGGSVSGSFVAEQWQRGSYQRRIRG